MTHVDIRRRPIRGAGCRRSARRAHSGDRQRVVLASGGFQADIDWLARAWGPAARNFLIRGTPYNRGVVLKDMLDQGAESVGDPTQCHAVAIDGRAPKFDGGIVTRLDCVPFSIVVNKDGERFYDEGEDVWPKRYAIWGRLVAAQPDQVGYVDHRQQKHRPVHAVGLPAGAGRHDRRAGPATGHLGRQPAQDGRRVQRRLPGRHVPSAPNWTVWRPRARARQDQLGAPDHRAAVLRL